MTVLSIFYSLLGLADLRDFNSFGVFWSVIPSICLFFMPKQAQAKIKFCHNPSIRKVTVDVKRALEI